MARIITICVVFLLSGLVACNQQDSYKHRTQLEGGICISFDDRTVDQWFELRELFNKYNAKVTFFVTRFDSLSAAQVGKLKILQADGHEIGFHGVLHVVSEQYIKEHSLLEYLDHEIVSGINTMNAQGFYPTSFSYPYSAKYTGTDKELLKYFYVLRSEAIIKKGVDIVTVNEAYYKHDGERLVYAMAIDRNGPLNSAIVEQAMKRAIEKKEVLMLYGHEPGRTFDTAFLEQILKLSRDKSLKFFRASDLVK